VVLLALDKRTGQKKSRVIIEIFAKTASKKNFLTVQGDFGKFIDVVWRKLCFLTV
jgi:hypothetical protein